MPTIQREGGRWKDVQNRYKPVTSSQLFPPSHLQACQLGPRVQVRGQNGNSHLVVLSDRHRQIETVETAVFLPCQIAMTPMWMLWPAGGVKPQNEENGGNACYLLNTISLPALAVLSGRTGYIWVPTKFEHPKSRPSV